jgi:hypothetical protein
VALEALKGERTLNELAGHFMDKPRPAPALVWPGT